MEDFLYSKEGSEERLKIEKIIKAQQPEVYKQLKKERKENPFNYIEKLMQSNKGVDKGLFFHGDKKEIE